MSNFKVGEVLVGQNITKMPQYNGAECVVIEGLKKRRHYCGEVFSYKVQWADGFIICVWPGHLRRKQPPAGEQSILDMFKLPVPKRIGEPA